MSAVTRFCGHGRGHGHGGGSLLVILVSESTGIVHALSHLMQPCQGSPVCRSHTHIPKKVTLLHALVTIWCTHEHLTPEQRKKTHSSKLRVQAGYACGKIEPRLALPLRPLSPITAATPAPISATPASISATPTAAPPLAVRDADGTKGLLVEPVGERGRGKFRTSVRK